MTTLDNILEATCDVFGINKENMSDVRKIDEIHQIARIVYCRIAFDIGNGFSYRAIGIKINRKPSQVHHNIRVAKLSGYPYEETYNDINKKLKS